MGLQLIGLIEPGLIVRSKEPGNSAYRFKRQP